VCASESEEWRCEGAVKLSVCVRVDSDGMRRSHSPSSIGLVCEGGN